MSARGDLVLAAWVLWLVARANGWERERYEARAIIRAIRWSTATERRTHAMALVRSSLDVDAGRAAFRRILAASLLAANATI